MKKMLSLLLAMMMCLSLAACGDSGDGKTSEGDTADGDTPDKVYTLKMTYTISGDETVAKCAQEMAEKVEERTNGGLVLENYPNGEYGCAGAVCSGRKCNFLRNAGLPDRLCPGSGNFGRPLPVFRSQ